MDFTTTYLGFKLKSPLVASSSPMTQSLEGILRLEESGAAAIVMHSLFEEQITLESLRLNHYLDYFTESFAESLSYFPEMESYNVGPEEYLNLIRQAKKSLSVPLIGSLNGITTGGWIDYATRIQQAGADALELNIYYIPTNPEETAEQVEQRYIDILRSVKEHVEIPVAVKIGPSFSSIAHMAKRLVEAGADALVLFNRFYQPDYDIENLEVTPHLVLSSSHEMRLPLRWVAILYGRIAADFAITSGVHTAEDAIKGVMAGANIVMMTSELLQNGPDRLRVIAEEMHQWMVDREYESVEQMRGSMSQQHVAEPAVFARANYMKVLQSWRPDPTGRLM